MRLAIVHQLPLEYYPPVTNAICFFAGDHECDLLAISTKNAKGRCNFQHEAVDVRRPLWPDSGLRAPRRLFGAFRWHRDVAKALADWQPDLILYYEPHSALAIWLYYLCYFGKAVLAIHHHEYYSPSDYLNTGNRLTRINHFFEQRWLYQRANWISQTNQPRIDLFHQDHGKIEPKKLHVLANYPPASWRDRSQAARGEREHKLRVASGEKRKGRSRERAKELKLVYVGSVSLHDTFIGPLVDWILGREDDSITLDVFAYNADEKTKKFLRVASGEKREASEAVGKPSRREREAGKGLLTNASSAESVRTPCPSPPNKCEGQGSQSSGVSRVPGDRQGEHRSEIVATDHSLLAASHSSLASSVRARVRYFEQGVEYDDLPEVLAGYDVGVILYRCNTTNYKFNASNKLFEYLACGLEVWYPPQMLGVKPYARDDVFPRVLEVDYERLSELDLDRMRDHEGLPDAPPPPCCEDEFEKLLAAMRGK